MVSFFMISPPLAVVGTLPIAHALTFTVQDIVSRRKKMQGFDWSWIPGPDYARVFPPLKELGIRLGLALDWDQVKIIPTEEISDLVTKAFVQLYHEGTIYKKTAVSRQWFLKPSRLAKRAGKAIENDEISFVPSPWGSRCLDWLYHLQEWCISRQAQQGHRIPAYYCQQCHHLMVEEKPPAKCFNCSSTHIEPDPEVLDNRFSSALWPFPLLEWVSLANNTAAVPPISVITVGLDIFFSWAPRMIMMALYFSKKVPCQEILVNGFTRDEYGQKMCRAKNNLVDPLEMIETYGADSLRFTLAIRATPGKNIGFAINHLKGYRAFITKIRNASRYVIMHLKGNEDSNLDFASLTDPDKWILHALNNLIVKINEELENYRIGKAAYWLYHFFRHEYCDWYLEFSKNDLHNPETRKTLKLTLYRLLQALHPFIPFITEELYQSIKNDDQPFLLQTEFPAFTSEAVFSHEFTEVEALKKIISETRKTRARNIIHPKNRIYICLKTESEKEKAALSRNMKYFDSLTRSAKTEIVPDFSHLPKGFRGSCLNWEILLPLDSDEDRKKELTRLNRELEKLEPQVRKLEKKLSNDRFVNKTPASMVLQLKKDLRRIIDRRDRTRETIHDLS